MANIVDGKKTRGRPRAPSSEKPGNTVQSLDRALRLLRSIASSEQITLTELAMMTGMAPSTAHRLLMTLQQQNFVAFDETAQHWHIGVEAFRVGSSFVGRTRVVDAGRPVMSELMAETGETCNLAIADNGEVVFISQIETPAAIRASFPPGARGEMHSSGIGKALLAEYHRDKVKEILQKKGLPSFTSHTITSVVALFEELEKVRQRGWSVDYEERNIGMRCLAAAIFNEYGEAVAGVSISGPRARLTDERLSEFGPLVKRMAARITESIGGVAPSHEST